MSRLYEEQPFLFLAWIFLAMGGAGAFAWAMERFVFGAPKAPKKNQEKKP